MPKCRRSAALALLATVAHAGAASPVDTPPTPDSSPVVDISGVRFSIFGATEWFSAADFSDVAGDLSVARLGAGLNVEFGLTDRLDASVSVTHEISFYDIRDNPTLSPLLDESTGSDADLSTSETAFTARLTWKLDDRWSIFLGGGGRFALEPGASWGKSFAPIGLAGATYVFNDRLVLGGGLAIADQLEDSVLVLPLIIVNWRITDRLTLSNGAGGLRRATWLQLSYAIDDNWVVYCEGGYAFRDFRLDSDGPTPDGVFRERRLPVGVGVLFNAGPNIKLGLRGGFAFGGNIEVTDSSGSRLFDQDLDGSAYLGFDVNLRF
ncbi:MAG: hypothetical protein KF866_04365 [Phycisphaeraceae bacterium]|nr:hypothetical protein [Phycisphaeraceae bacterium]MCW5753083.1 hypothetical protein [Phycisphaeraceae bacterium]